MHSIGLQEMNIECDKIYKVIKEMPVSGTVHFSAPVSGGFKGFLPVGAELRLNDDFEEGDTYIQCFLVHPEKYESMFASKADLCSPKYAGVSFDVTPIALSKFCEIQ